MHHLCSTVVVTVVVMILTHRYSSAVGGDRTGSHNSGVNYLRWKFILLLICVISVYPLLLLVAKCTRCSLVVVSDICRRYTGRFALKVKMKYFTEYGWDCLSSSQVIPFRHRPPMEVGSVFYDEDTALNVERKPSAMKIPCFDGDIINNEVERTFQH